MAAEEERVKRPPNAWILFRTYYGGTQPVYPDGTRIPQNQISTVASKIWNKFTEPQRRPWEEQADQAKVAHMVAHPNWRYRPRSKAVKEQQKLEERLAKAAAREEAKRAKQAAKRAASGTHTNAGGVKRSPSRRLSPAVVASPYPCVSPLPGISLANFGPSPPASAASSPMVAPLTLPTAAEQSPAATLVGTPDQPKYPVLTLDSHIHTPTTTITTTTPAPIPTLTIHDTNDKTHTNINTGLAVPVDPATATPADSKDLDLDFFARHFTNAAGDGSLMHGGDFGMDAGHMGLDATAEWGLPGAMGNHLGLMQNSNLSFPLDPDVFGDFTGWAAAQVAEDLNGGTPGADFSGSPNTNSADGSNSATATPETSFELPFIFNMDGSGGPLGLGLGFDAGMDLSLNMNMNLGMNLHMELGAPVAQPGGGSANGFYSNPYAGVGNFGGLDFGALDAAGGDWTGNGSGMGDAGLGLGMNVNFDAFADLDLVHQSAEQARVKKEEEEEYDHAHDRQPEIHVVEDDEDENDSKQAVALAAASASARASPESYASPSAYALQPVENRADTPHSRASSSASSSTLSYVSATSTPSAHAHAHGEAYASTQSGGTAAGVYAPPKGAGNGNRRVAASFKVPPAIVRTASLGWVPKTAGGAA